MAKTPWGSPADTPARTWSTQQTAIFAWFAAMVGHLVVRARAGTGKTTTILEAIRHIPGDARILLAAFNARIARELNDKLHDERAEAKTLHSLGYAMLRRAWPKANVPRDNPSEMDDERIAAVAGAVPNDVVPVIKKLIGLLKGMAPDATQDEAEDIATNYGCVAENGNAAAWNVARIATVALGAMKESHKPDPAGRITFDDMVYLPVVLGFARPTFDVVVVDEAQDMNASQLMLAQMVCKPKGHIVVVGDDCQAIYGFRGADSGSIDRLKQELNATELGLTTTYRCPKTVVAVARQLVGDFNAAETAPEGYVASLPEHAVREWCGVGDAVLSRVNAPLVSLCLGFIRQGTPARIEGRDIGREMAKTVKSLHAQSIPDFLARVRAYQDKMAGRIKAKGKGVESKLDNLADKCETMCALAEGCKSVSELLTRCTTMFADSDGRPVASVVLSSVHKAKGLEWQKVFILERTLYCNGRRQDQEERNIVYVAVTRSKESLVMVQG